MASTPHVLGTVQGAEGTDQAEARAANVALWPATWGYFLDTMLNPGFDLPAVDGVRAFFTEHVSGRGAIPAIRIGRQPYGILPATVLSRLRLDERRPRGSDPALTPGVLDELSRILAFMAASWTGFADDVPHVSSAGDPHQTLLDVLGLHPVSVEFHQRYAQTLEEIYNETSLMGAGATP